ncbi:MAG: DUF1922 domain-containing protein [Candidatus Lokiarchaeota archaeon]|nr:DUF1922 domain-containing protein [Candidatus Lokiarchaeota archaeon]
MGKYFFYRCIHCGEWYYSTRRIKRKKCWKCNHSFEFSHSSKFIKNCSSNEAIIIIKELKKKGKKEDLLGYLV